MKPSGCPGGRRQARSAAAERPGELRVSRRRGCASGACTSTFGSSWRQSSVPRSPSTRRRRSFSWPIALTTEVGDCPWAPSHKLVLIGARAKAPVDREITGRNITKIVQAITFNPPWSWYQHHAGLKMLLEMWGFDVTVAHDGLSALAAIRDVQPRAALLATSSSKTRTRRPPC